MQLNDGETDKISNDMQIQTPQASREIFHVDQTDLIEGFLLIYLHFLQIILGEQKSWDDIQKMQNPPEKENG